MRPATYRLCVVGGMLAAFLLGLHVPALHQMFEHGRTVRWDIAAASALLGVITLACGWTLVRHGR